MTLPTKRRTVRRAGLLAAALLAGALAVPGVGNAARPGPDEANCGPRLMKSSGGLWRCTFADDFDGSGLDRESWHPLLTARTGNATGECRVDEPDTIGVADGALHLSVRDRGEPFVCETPTGSFETRYAAGGVHTMGAMSQTYGRFEARIKFPHSTIKGLHSAWWLWPERKLYGDLSGEIDIAEWRSGLADRVVPTVHYADGGLDPNKTNWHCYISDPWNYHTYTVEWDQEAMRFLYDGEVCLVNTWVSASGLTKPAPFDEDFFLILNQSIGIGLNEPTADTELPATMSVDYVRVWS